MKIISKKWALFFSMPLASAPLALVLACGSTTTTSEPTILKEVRPDLALLKKVTLTGNAVHFTLTNLVPEMTNFDSSGAPTSAGEEGALIEARVKVINGATSEQVNTSFMPYELLQAYFKNQIDFKNGEPVISKNSITTSIKKLYGSSYNFTKENTQLPDYTGVIIPRDSFVLRYAARPGYNLSAGSDAEVIPTFDADFKEMVTISLAIPKFFTTEKINEFFTLVGFSPSSNNFTNFSSNISYYTPNLSASMMPDEWQKYAAGFEFTTASEDEVYSASPSVVWSSERPKKLPYDETKRHITVRLVPKNNYQFFALSNRMDKPFAIDIYSLIAGRNLLYTDLTTNPQWNNFNLGAAALSWNSTSNSLVIDTVKSGTLPERVGLKWEVYVQGAGPIIVAEKVLDPTQLTSVPASVSSFLASKTPAERAALADSGKLRLTIVPIDETKDTIVAGNSTNPVQRVFSFSNFAYYITTS